MSKVFFLSWEIWKEQIQAELEVSSLSLVIYIQTSVSSPIFIKNSLAFITLVMTGSSREEGRMLAGVAFRQPFGPALPSPSSGTNSPPLLERFLYLL